MEVSHLVKITSAGWAPFWAESRNSSRASCVRLPMNDFVRNCYFGEELMETMAGLLRLARKHRTTRDTGDMWLRASAHAGAENRTALQHGATSGRLAE